MQETGKDFVEPVVFADEDLRPTPEAYNAVSFGCGQEETLAEHFAINLFLMESPDFQGWAVWRGGHLGSGDI